MPKLQSKAPDHFSRVSLYYATVIRVLLNILLAVICVALAIGVFKAGYDLATSLNQPLEKLLQQILVDTVFIIALVEISIMIVSYLKDGSVHVRYILDTVLIIMLNEIVAIWFDDPKLEKMLGLALIVGVLAISRVLLTFFPPKKT